MVIDPKTRQQMMRAWGIGMVAFIAPASMTYRISPALAMEMMVVMPLVLASSPLTMQFVCEKRAKIDAARVRRLEEYRASPESHLLRLDDGANS